MLKLKSLRLSGFGRFVEEQIIEFETLGNLIQVDGENRKTGGSSGSGKSTLFNALDFLLGLNDLPTTVLQSRLTKDKLSVTGEFDWDGKRVVITRGSKLSVEIDGELTQGSSALAEEKIDSILGMPRDIFRKVLHKRQKEGGFFLDFTPKKMYEFLTDALNLAAERKKLEKVEEKLKSLEEQKKTRQTNIGQAQSSLKAMQEAILGLGLAPVRDIHQSVILELKGRYDGSTQKHKETEEKHRQETQVLEEKRPKVSVAAYDTSSRDALDARHRAVSSARAGRVSAESDRIAGIGSTISALRVEQTKIAFTANDGQAARSEAVTIAEQIKKIRACQCPTCEQQWLTDSAKTHEAQLIAKLALVKDRIAAGAAAVEKQAELAANLAALEAQLTPQNTEELAKFDAELADILAAIKEDKAKEAEHMMKQNAANSSVLQQFAAEQAELRRKQAQEADQTRGQADVDRRAFDAAVAKLKAYDDAAKKYESTLSYMKTNEAVYAKQLAENEAALSVIDAEILMAEELKKIVKTFISCSFDDALESIGEAATKIIRCIPTMSSATIQFEGQKETKDGKVKEEVNAVISMDGDIGIPIKSLSGGERSSVDLAVDLAVIDFIESESAKGIDVFILDEPFTGLDTVSIEMALEVLKNSNSTKKLIVVDHNPEVKQMVSNRIVVVRDGDTSTIANREV